LTAGGSIGLLGGRFLAALGRHPAAGPAHALVSVPAVAPSVDSASHDGLHGKADLVAAELGHYQRFLGILRDQIGNVGTETEGAALDILTRLAEIDRRIRAIIAFVEPSGTDDDVSELMLRSEVRMAENRRLLDEFRSNRMNFAQIARALRARRARASTRSWVWSPGSIALSPRSAQSLVKPACCRSTRRSKRRKPARTAKASRSWRVK
jgi:hypothetical protein